jgi:hypothetical protein
MPKFRELLSEHFEQSYTTGDKEPWRIFSYVDTLKVDLLLYSFVHVKEGLEMPREILRWIYRCWKAVEARHTAVQSTAEEERAKKQLTDIKAVLVFLNSRFKDYIGTKMQRIWNLQKYTEIDVLHTELADGAFRSLGFCSSNPQAHIDDFSCRYLGICSRLLHS